MIRLVRRVRSVPGLLFALSLILLLPVSAPALHAQATAGSGAIEGTILDANLPIRGLALQHYDGRGHITQVDHLVSGGYPPPQAWTPGTGTYTVNPDCTGSAVIISPSSAPPGSSGPPPPLNIHFVITDHGKQIVRNFLAM